MNIKDYNKLTEEILQNYEKKDKDITRDDILIDTMVLCKYINIQTKEILNKLTTKRNTLYLLHNCVKLRYVTEILESINSHLSN